MSDTPSSGELEASLVETLTSSALVDVAADVGEVALDSLLSEGVARDIPILGSLIGLWKAGVTVRDALFLRKLIAFLRDLSEVPVEERQRAVNSLADPSTGERVGAQLLSLLDRLDSVEKARILAAAFRAYVVGTISRIEFWRVSFIVDRLPLTDIIAIVPWREIDLNRAEHVRKHLYLSVGLGWFVLDASSAGFVWEERLCSILAELVLAVPRAL